MDIRFARWDDLNESQKVQKHYLVALESVSLINDIVGLNERSEDNVQTVDRNVKYLRTMKAKDFWEGQDMTPIDNAIIAGESYVSG